MSPDWFVGDIGDFEVKAHRSAVWKHEAEVLERQKHKCASCNEVMMDGWSLHRITPRSMGGRDSAENVTILCFGCSRDKRELRTISAKIPSGLYYEMKKWKGKHMPSASVSQFIRLCIEKQISDNSIEIDNNTLSGLQEKASNHDDLLAKERRTKEVIGDILTYFKEMYSEDSPEDDVSPGYLG